MADAKLSALTAVSVPDLADLAYLVDVSDTTDDAAGSSRQVALYRLLGMLNHVCQGRLTLTSGTPVTTSDVTGATSVYFTPYNGNLISIYDGTRWKLYAFSELTLALGTLTSGLPYDVFIYDNAGTLTLESLAWTNGTTRATALTTQDGVNVKTGATTRRYLGTFYTTSTTTTADAGGTGATGAQRFLFNAYNQVRRSLHACPGYSDGNTSTSYTTTSTTFTQANGGTGAKAEFLLGLSGTVDVLFAAVANNSGANSCLFGVGLDSTSTPVVVSGTPAIATTSYAGSARDTVALDVGYHYASLLIAVGGGTGTFLADSARLGASADPQRTTLDGSIFA